MLTLHTRKPARQTELRHVMPSRIAARDTGASDRLKSELEKKKGKLKAEEKSLDQSRLALAVINNQIKSRERNLKYKQVFLLNPCIYKFVESNRLY